MRLRMCLLLVFAVSLLAAQEEIEKGDSLYFHSEPDSLYLEVGDSALVTIKFLKGEGELANNPFYVYGKWGTLSVIPRISDSSGVAVVLVKAYKPGSHTVSVRSITVKRLDRVRDKIPVEVPFPPIETIVFNDPSPKLYAGTSLKYRVTVYDQAGLTREGVNVSLSTDDPGVAEFDALGNLWGRKPGRVTILANVGEITARVNVHAVRNPVRAVELEISDRDFRTGDVVRCTARAVTRSGRVVTDAPIKFSFTGEADYGIGLPASGQITQEGRFVAETAGVYTIYASSGGYSAGTTVRVVPRKVRKKLELVGHGLVSDVFTSDLWVWPGVGEFEGRDFAVTGTWGANGEAYFWEVTDPANMIIIDTVTVDARTVNDVKISKDGRIGIITREGASNRKNGFVILDVYNPFEVKILSKFNDDMTGGVHNAFIYQNHVYAVNNGRKYDIINIEDPAEPFRVGVYELKSPGHTIHDVWIVDGVAYSSNWYDGVHIVDVGGLTFNQKNLAIIQATPVLRRSGKGSPSNPLSVSHKSDSTGRNHAAFPFLSQSTGDFYVIAGDEEFPFGLAATKRKPSNPRGGFHFINFNDADHRVEVAIYQVPEAGSHNLWAKGDTLYAAFYQGGLRVLDISGELLGDLYRQGREIAFFLSGHPDGHLPNAPMVWSPQPYKDLIFFSDMNSGLYAVRLVEEERVREE